MRKMCLWFLAVTLLLGAFSGCSREKAVEAAAYVPEVVTISGETEKEGKKLTLHAEVEIPDLNALETIRLVFDEESFQRAGKDLVLSQYPELKEGRSPDGYRSWSKETPERLLIAFDCDDESFRAGWCYYIDVLRDLNGQGMGEDDRRAFDAHYLTAEVPDKLGMTSSEAAKIIGEALEKYSCFTYKPWNVAAYNIGEKSESSGYYSARMQPHFDGLPVVGNGPLMASTHISAEGLFAFQGVILLKEKDRSPAVCAMDLETAVGQFRQDFVEEANEGAEVYVNKITAGYLAQSEYDGTWNLYPAWIFECHETRNGYTRSYTSVYKMETGSLMIVD